MMDVVADRFSEQIAAGPRARERGTLGCRERVLLTIDEYGTALQPPERYVVLREHAGEGEAAPLGETVSLVRWYAVEGPGDIAHRQSFRFVSRSPGRSTSRSAGRVGTRPTRTATGPERSRSLR
jgi:hypothetical protein